jgi:hypothetical protein
MTKKRVVLDFASDTKGKQIILLLKARCMLGDEQEEYLNFIRISMKSANIVDICLKFHVSLLRKKKTCL